MRILIAEDDQVLADGLLRSLRGSGAVVSHVANGSEADTALMTSSEFDLLILDLGLPKMHGLEVLKKLEMGEPVSLESAAREHLSKRLRERGLVEVDSSHQWHITAAGRAQIRRTDA